MDTTNLADRNELPNVDWSSVTARLDAGYTQAPGEGGPDPPWTVYRVTARSASAVATVEPGGATRWTF